MISSTSHAERMKYARYMRFESFEVYMLGNSVLRHLSQYLTCRPWIVVSRVICLGWTYELQYLLKTSRSLAGHQRWFLCHDFASQ